MSLKVWFLYKSLRLTQSLAKRRLPRSDILRHSFEDDLSHALESRKHWDVFSRLIAWVNRMPSDVVHSVQYKHGVKTSIISPSNPAKGVILYIHGGGWRLPAGSLHAAYSANLAKSTQIPVWMADYSLSPENPFPAGLMDVAAVYAAMLAEGHDHKMITIIGDSAGGNLTLALLLLLKQQGRPLPGAAISLSPATDAYMLGKSFITKAEADPVLISELGRPAYNSYMQGASPDNPLISPLYGDLNGLPPLLILVGGQEILLDDSVKFAEKARQAGVDVTLDVHDAMFHSYPLFYDLLEEAKTAMGKVALFIHLKTGLKQESLAP